MAIRDQVLFVLCALCVASAPAAADSASIAGKYTIKFEEVQNSCKSTGMNFKKATIELTAGKRKRIDVSIPMVPLMRGVASKGGKFKAKAKRGGTAIKGVDGRFSISGRINDDVMQMVLIAEYFAGKKPLCTKSWNGTGIKQ